MNLRKIDNDLEGHPTPRLDFIDVATGSLGQGLSIAAGMAYTAKNFDKARSAIIHYFSATNLANLYYGPMIE